MMNDDKAISYVMITSALKTIIGILLLIPILWWLFGEFFGWWGVDLYDWDYVLVGLSAIAGAYLVINGGVNAVLTIFAKYEHTQEGDHEYTIKSAGGNGWDRICEAKTYKLNKNGTLAYDTYGYIYAVVKGNKTYYRFEGGYPNRNYYLMDNPYYGEDSERGRAKYKDRDSDIYVTF